jgi:5-methylthioribose kinase
MTHATPDYRPLAESSVIPYLRGRPEIDSFFGADAELTCTDLADGNVNLVFRVASRRDPARSLIVKQALPHARRYPEFKMPLGRAAIERGALMIYSSVAPGIAPRPVGFDGSMFVNIMEDLSSHAIVREGVVRQVEYPSFATTMGTFLARSLLLTSDIAVDPSEKKQRVVDFSNPVLCKVTEDLVFTFPFIDHPTNRFPAAIADTVAALRGNTAVARGAARAKLSFMTSAQSLSHGDLHTGSIMANRHETRVIDPEFAFYGPIAFDVGMLIANLAIASFAQEFHASSAASRRAYRAWLAAAATETLDGFRAQFADLWESASRPEWRVPGLCREVLADIERDAVLFCGCEMIRRTIGMAHVSELDSITDEPVLARVSRGIVEAGAKALAGEARSLAEVVGAWPK